MERRSLDDAVRTPRGKGKRAGGALYEVKPIDWVAILQWDGAS